MIIQLYVGYTLVAYGEFHFLVGTHPQANLECKTMVVFCRCPPNQSAYYIRMLCPFAKINSAWQGIQDWPYLLYISMYLYKLLIHIYMIIYRHTHTCNHGSWNHLMFQPLVIGTWWQATGFAPVEHSSLETSLHTLRLQEVMARIEMEDCPEGNGGAQNLIS